MGFKELLNMNGIVIVDKPAGITSHDVVARLRRIYNTRRIGHSGTLDPLATGVLPIFVGRATRACEFALCDNKKYKAKMKLGLITDTQDITGSVLEEHEVSASFEDLKRAAEGFVGEISQTPPMYSAIKVGGVKLYELARKGESVERKPRQITIHSIDCEEAGDNEYYITVSCSKGTYIRTLCEDIGRALGCGATLTELRRLSSGGFSEENAKTLEEIAENPEASLLPTDFMFSEFDAVKIDAAGEKKCRNGAAVPFSAELGKKYRVYSESGEFLMLAEGGKDGELITVKSFFEV